MSTFFAFLMSTEVQQSYVDELIKKRKQSMRGRKGENRGVVRGDFTYDGNGEITHFRCTCDRLLKWFQEI